MLEKTFLSSDGYLRCSWCQSSSLYINYHDNEWGYQNKNDYLIFACLSLEIFQAGLSWITVLKKRNSLYKEFSNFNYALISQYDSKKIESLLKVPSIIKNLKKIESVIINAKKTMELVDKEGSLKTWLWSFLPAVEELNRLEKEDKLKDFFKYDVSEKILYALKIEKGWQFMGPTIIYSFMQAIGMVNGHEKSCFMYSKLNSTLGITTSK